MIVKPQTLRTDGHHPSAAARRAYLEREGRALEVRTNNVMDPRHWDREMDATTAAYACRGQVHAREYVLALEPADAATPSQVADMALAWAQECFPNHEASVIVHDDGKEHAAKSGEPLLHAHVYVNAVDLESGLKMSVSNRDARAYHDRAQDMCRERGWGEQERYVDQAAGRFRVLESRRSDFERRPMEFRSARFSAEDMSPKAVEARAYEGSAFARAGLGHAEYSRQAARLAARDVGLPKESWPERADKTAAREAVQKARDAVLANPSSAADRSAAILADHRAFRAELESRGFEVAKSSKAGELKVRAAGEGRWFKLSSLSAAGIDLSTKAISAEIVARHDGPSLGRDARGLELE